MSQLRYLSIVFVALAGLAQATPEFALVEAAPGLYVHLGQHVDIDAAGRDDIANIGFVVGDACVAVIDTGGSVRIGRALHEAIRRTTRLPVCHVINSHVHFDHLLGNAAFRDEHADFIGHARLPEAVRRSRAFFLEHYGSELEAGSAGGGLIEPSRRVDSELRLDLGHRTLVLHAWDVAHTDCDLTVLDERTGTLWSGDLLFTQRLPAVDAGARGWLTTLQILSGMKIARAVPGHGNIATDWPAVLEPERRYLQSVVAAVRSDLKAGRPMQAALEHAGESERGRWLLWDQTHPRNVARIWQELEWE